MLYVHRGRARYSESKICSDRDTKLDEVIEDCRCAMELDSECAHAYNLLGTVYFQKSDYEEAIVYFNEAIRYEKEAEPRYRCNRGEAQLHLKKWENALEGSLLRTENLMSSPHSVTNMKALKTLNVKLALRCRRKSNDC